MERGFVAALVAGVAYMAVVFGWLDGPGAIVLKGAGVTLLALWAASWARSADGWLFVAVMAVGAAGDVLLDAKGLRIGGAVFLVGHVLAVTLYRRNGAPWSGIVAAGLAVAGVASMILSDPGMMLYAFGLGAMAGGASGSRFPWSVTIGAWLFVASDLLIFSRSGLLAHSILPRLLVWPTYFGGQALIAWGVVTTLRHRRT